MLIVGAFDVSLKTLGMDVCKLEGMVITLGYTDVEYGP
jgi:hypothetical protein